MDDWGIALSQSNGRKHHRKQYNEVLFMADIPPEVKIDAQHAILALQRRHPEKSGGFEQDKVKEMISKLKLMRSRIVFLMRESVISLVIAEAKRQKLYVFGTHGELVSNLSEITKVWTHCHDTETGRKIWMAFFGWFDVHDEEQFMKNNKWKYIDHDQSEHRSKSKKGCVARVIRNIKNSLVKNLNALTRKRGKVLTVERTSEEVKKDPNFRRKFGVFYPWCVRQTDEFKQSNPAIHNKVRTLCLRCITYPGE